MPKEVGGTNSTFGQQVLSTKATEAHTKFGTSIRTEKLAETPFEFKLLGGTSPGFSTAVQSGFGPQTLSRNHNQPAQRFGGRYGSDHDMHKEARPGPGAYQATESVGRQVLSKAPTSPQFRVGTANRFGHFKKQFKDDYITPAAGAWKPSSGWIGDASAYTFHGKSKRADISVGLPGQRPTASDDPGPGTYELPSSLGPQHNSMRQSMPASRVGTAERDKQRSIYMAREFERDLLSKHSPAPNTYSPNKAVSSRVKSPGTFKFGTSDRFSDFKPITPNANKLHSFAVNPGPGAYVV